MKKTWPFFAGGLIFIFATLVVAGPQISNPPGVQTATAPLAVTGQDVSIACAGNGQAGALCPVTDGGIDFQIDGVADGGPSGRSLGVGAIRVYSGVGQGVRCNTSQCAQLEFYDNTGVRRMYMSTTALILSGIDAPTELDPQAPSGSTGIQGITGQNWFLGTGGVAGLSYNGTNIASTVGFVSNAGLGINGSGGATQGLSGSGASTLLRASGSTGNITLGIPTGVTYAIFTGGAPTQPASSIAGDVNVVGGLDGGGGLVTAVKGHGINPNALDGGAAELAMVVGNSPTYGGVSRPQMQQQSGIVTFSGLAGAIAFDPPFNSAVSQDGGLSIVCGATFINAGAAVESGGLGMITPTVSGVTFTRDAGPASSTAAWFCNGPRIP